MVEKRFRYFLECLAGGRAQVNRRVMRAAIRRVCQRVPEEGRRQSKEQSPEGTPFLSGGGEVTTSLNIAWHAPGICRNYADTGWRETSHAITAASPGNKTAGIPPGMIPSKATSPFSAQPSTTESSNSFRGRRSGPGRSTRLESAGSTDRLRSMPSDVERSKRLFKFAIAVRGVFLVNNQYSPQITPKFQP